MKVNIITDSASDFSIEEAKKLDIAMLPLQITFGEDTYYDAIDLDHNAFFEKLIETDVFPKTSQITPYEYKKAFSEVEEMKEEAVVITLSSKLSGCYQSACLAATDMNGIYVIDSLNACVGQRILVEYAVRLRDQGLSAKEIYEACETAKTKIRLVALLDTLEYLKKGGRISSTVAFAGAVLSIRPVIAIEGGEVILLGKARGSKNGNNKLIEVIKTSGGIDFDMPFSLVYSGLSKDVLNKYIEDSHELYEEHSDAASLPVCSIGCAIGSHIGPGAVGLAFFTT